MEKHISGGTIPANLLGNQIFVSGGGCDRGWIRERHKCPNLKALCFSVPLGIYNMLQGCFCGVCLCHCMVIGEMLCPLLPSQGQFADSH